MAEERPPASLKKPPKPRSQKPEKPHSILPRKGKELLRIPLQKFQQEEPPVFGRFAYGNFRNWCSHRYLTSASPMASEISLLSVSNPDVEEPDLEQPESESSSQDLAINPKKSTPLLHQPTTVIYLTRSSLIISTEYQRKKQPPEPPLTLEMLPEDPPLVLPWQGQPEELESEIVASEHGKAESEGSSSRPAGSSKQQVQQPTRKAASIKSGKVAREIGKELDQKQEEFFHVTSLTKQIEPAPLQTINLKCLPILYHESYNMRFMRTMIVKASILPNKPAEIFAKLHEMLFTKYNCSCITLEVTDFHDYTDVVNSPVIPDAVKKCDITEVTKILKVRFLETFSQQLPTWSEFDSAMLHPLRVQVNGSLQACGVATYMGWAINIGGGFCYNSVGFSKGLAVYDDLLHCLLTLPESTPGYSIEQILVINNDAYQCSSYKHVKEIQCPVTILDFYYEKMPDSEKIPSQYCNELVVYKSFKIDSPNAAVHVGMARKEIESVIKTYERKPALCIYVAGTNVTYRHDKPSRVFQSEHVADRDLDVFQTVYLKYGIPIAILFGGGNEESDVRAAAISITRLCEIGSKFLNIAWIDDTLNYVKEMLGSAKT